MEEAVRKSVSLYKELTEALRMRIIKPTPYKEKLPYVTPNSDVYYRYKLCSMRLVWYCVISMRIV